MIFPNLSPTRIISIGILAGVLLISFVTFLNLQHPWLGINIKHQPEASSLTIVNVIKNSPAENILKSGDKILAFKTENQLLKVTPVLNIHEPAFLPDYKSHNDFIALQDEVSEILNYNLITIKLKDKDVIIIPASTRPLSSLPFTSYWLIILFGFTAFIIGLNIWSFRRGIIVSRILAISGCGFFLGALFNAVTLSREIALPGDFYYTISSISHFGILLFAFSTLAILWHYPQKISKFPATTIIYFTALLIWLNQTAQIITLPFHAYYFHFLVDFIFLAGFAVRQWHQARESIIDQAALQWLLFTLLISLGLTIILFYMPTIYATKPILPLSATYFTALLMFLGLTMGVIKYRLFNLPQIWMEAWVWIIGGSLLLLIDIALVYLLQLTSGYAFFLSAIIVGWIYFPARQWLSVNILKLKPKSIERYFPVLIEQLVTTHSIKSFEKKWEVILREVFLPLDISYIAEAKNTISTSNNSINLNVPTLDNKSTLLLTYKDSGNKLYSQNDIRLCQSLYNLTQHTANIKQSYEEGANDERNRIARDLHDDTAAQLLTLIHRSKDPQTIDQSRNILKSLREIIYSLDSDASVNIETALNSLYHTCNEKILLENIKLNWESIIFTDNITVSPRQQINIKRSLDEIISNVINHAQASKITISISMDNTNLHIEICDNGIGGNLNNWTIGAGLNTVRTRIQEINGKVHWQNNGHLANTRYQRGCCINLQVPI